MDIFFKSSQDLVESVISAHSVNMSLWYWVMWISFHMLLLPSVQRQCTCLREKIQNLTSTKLPLWPSCFNYTAELKKAGKYKTTKGYHHVKHCWDIHNPTTLWACWVGSEPEVLDYLLARYTRFNFLMVVTREPKVRTSTSPLPYEKNALSSAKFSVLSLESTLISLYFARKMGNRWSGLLKHA